MEVKFVSIKPIKKVHEKVTHVRWPIQGFYSRAMRKIHESIQSEEFVFDESAARTRVCMYYPNNGGNHMKFNCSVTNLGIEKRLDIQCKCWLENKGEVKKAESEGIL